MLPDVVHELAAKIGRGFEDAAGDHVALDLRKPELNLVEPRAVGRRVVNRYPRVLSEPPGREQDFCRRVIRSSNSQ